MKKITFKRSRYLPDLSSPGKKRLFRIMNTILLIGVAALVAAFLILLNNLEKADNVVILTVPLFFMGIALITIYYYGYARSERRKRKSGYFDKETSY
ncbi:MAG TPA: hypothetical protein VE870_05390 [Bacteroidales bacterium]|nr:hypothetical protein [Bacteroidales bacterium]